MHLNQQQMAGVLGVSQSGYSRKEKGLDEITTEQLITLVNDLHIEPNFLLKGEGPITLNVLDAVSEPLLIESSADLRYSPTAQASRFRELVQSERTRLSKTLKDYIEEILKLDNEHVHNMMNGRKPLTYQSIMNAVRYGRMNANYIMTGDGDRFLDTSQKRND